MCVCTTIGKGDELGEGIWALGAAEESRVAALGLGDTGGGKRDTTQRI